MLLNKRLVYCAETRASLTAGCIAAPRSSFYENGSLSPPSRMARKSLFGIKREMTPPCLSWSTAAPINPVRGALQRSRLGTRKTRIDPGSHPEWNLDKLSDPAQDKQSGRSF